LNGASAFFVLCRVTVSFHSVDDSPQNRLLEQKSLLVGLLTTPNPLLQTKRIFSRNTPPLFTKWLLLFLKQKAGVFLVFLRLLERKLFAHESSCFNGHPQRTR